MIWIFAMGRNYINGSRKNGNKGRASTLANPRCNIVLSAFHLPEVCRQVYSETVLLAYKHNVITVDCDILDPGWHWPKILLPAQRNAVTSVLLVDNLPHTYLAKEKDHTQNLLRAYFPNMKSIEVPDHELEVIIEHRRSSPRGTEALVTHRDWRYWLVQKLKEKEGNDIEVKIHRYVGYSTFTDEFYGTSWEGGFYEEVSDNEVFDGEVSNGRVFDDEVSDDEVSDGEQNEDSI
jgi:hypothetical protein